MSSPVWWEAETNKRRSTRTLSGAARLYEVESYVIVVAFTSPPLLVVDSTTFFLQIALLQGWIPLLVVDSLSFFWRASLSYHLDTFAQLWRASLSYRPINPHSFGAQSLSYRPTVRSALARNSLSYRPIRPHSFGAQALATVSTRLHSYLARQSHSYRQRYARTAMGHGKAIATVNDTSARLWHGNAIATVNDTPAQLGARQSPSFTNPLARLRMY